MVTKFVTSAGIPVVGYRLPVDAVQFHETMRALWLLFGAVVGACLGSFANVVVARLPAGESVAHPPSRCPSCKTPIAPWDNIPVVSWLVLRGRARCCGVPISPRYALVEALGLGLGWAVVAMDGPGVHAVLHGLMLLCLVCIALIDLDTFEVPPVLSVGLAVLAFGQQGWAVWENTHALRPAAEAFASGPLLGAVLGWGLMALLRVSSTFVARRTGRIGADEEAQGRGDEDMMWGIGAMLGPGALFWALAMGCSQGVAVAYGLRALHRRDGRTGAWRGMGPAGQAAAAAAAAGEPTTAEPPGDAVTSGATPGAEPGGSEDGWIPPENSIQLGPFLALGAVEALFAMPWLPPLDLVTAVQVLLGIGQQ